jgi:hypothetical protein
MRRTSRSQDQDQSEIGDGLFIIEGHVSRNKVGCQAFDLVEVVCGGEISFLGWRQLNMDLDRVGASSGGKLLLQCVPNCLGGLRISHVTKDVLGHRRKENVERS